MAILTNSGRAAAAAAIKSQALHMAWGSGDASWDTFLVPPTITTSALTQEVGRREVTQTAFVVPDEQGELVIPSGRFSLSTEPTKYLYLRFAFDYQDAPTSTIRELAVFTGTVRQSYVPADQKYLIPAEVLNHGQLLVVERIPRLDRTPSVRQQFEFVIQF